jgi:hypothetical protein
MSPSRELVAAGQLTVILGLCGSGKSWLLERLEVEVKSPHDGFATDRRHLTSIAEALRQGKSCAVIEIAYCHPTDRAAFERELRNMIPEVRITYICFENDLQKANDNCRRRSDGRDVQMLLDINTAVSAHYTIPPGADVRSIWTPE